MIHPSTRFFKYKTQKPHSADVLITGCTLIFKISQQICIHALFGEGFTDFS